MLRKGPCVMSRFHLLLGSLVLSSLFIGIVGGSQAANNQAILLPLVVKKPVLATPPTATPAPTPVAPPAPTPPMHTGDSTYYTATGMGNCSIDPPQNNLFGAMNRAEYANSAICGAYVEITSAMGNVVVQITDQCPECLIGRIDLSPQAFSQLAEFKQGIVPTTWRIVSPDLSGPIRYHFKEGSSQWWTAVQIRNHRNPIAKLEVRDANGQFVVMTRMSYNFFILNGDQNGAQQGLGPGPYTFHTTDLYGNSLIDPGITLNVAGDSAGKAQFPKP